MFLLDDATIVYSATDLAQAATCEFALLRGLDAKLGRVAPLELPGDAMLVRAARLGDRHEERVLAEYRTQLGPWDPTRGTGVAEIVRPERGTDRAALAAKHAETLDVLRRGADVVFQAGFFDGRFGGWADFLVRQGDAYAVHDTKLARHAKVTALLQVAAYADQLLTAGIRVAPDVHLVLGDRRTTSHRLADLLPVFRDRRTRLEAMLDAHQAQEQPVDWADPRYRACGRCDLCTPEVEARRDVLLVAGVRTTQRARLRDAGITTVDELAASSARVEGIGDSTLEKLRAQARLQARQEPPGGGDGTVVHELFAPEVVEHLPPPSPGDIFFDFEGDPLWTDDEGTDWGLEYLFGLVEQPADADGEPVFRAFWAHDRAEEKQALLDFLDYLARRREQYPGLHVYHYAAYEKTALLRLAGRHGVAEDVVDQLLRDGVLVDLYATVRAALRTGQRSYSIKKLEPLYLDSRREGVTTAGDSIVEYADACLLREAGDHTAWQERLDAIGRYNRDDCVSTLRLRDWLLAQAAAVRAAEAAGAVTAELTPAAAGPGDASGEDGASPEDDALVTRLEEFADDPRHLDADGRRSPDRQAVALLAAAVGYHWRERKPFWWGHFDRLLSDPADWTEKRSTFLVDACTVEEPWAVPPGKRTWTRRLRLEGRLEPGSDLRPGATVCGLYDRPVPSCAKTSENGLRGWTTNVTIREVRVEGVGRAARDVLVVEDRLRATDEQHDALPMALAPGTPPPTPQVEAAVRGLAEKVAADLPQLPDQPGMDLLRRRPPRLRGGGPLPQGPYVEAITRAIEQLDGSYLAVQGPPGTGKTYTGAHVIATLVERGWRVGVVAQSHAVVENMLRGVVGAGVDAACVGKKPATGQDDAGSDDPDRPWRSLARTADFTRFYADRTGGLVVGGTMWDFTTPGRLPADGLDLLVVDEAGQFSLANTVAVSTAARNLLLLGDPQQLPQVTQGRHPEPVDRSALGWLSDGHDTLPAHLGYFLATTWRMHPALGDAVSRLSYEGRLGSEPCTAERRLDGVPPGVHEVRVVHEGNAVASTEEADVVVDRVRDLVGRRWTDPARDVDRPLTPEDVIVVAPYNAQVWTVRQALDAAGLRGTEVGTVDKFQGQQRPVVLVTLAASSADDVPRGMEFLLNRNRLNVAVSRGQWAAYVIRSGALTDHLPRHPDGLAELGAFLGLTSRVDDDRPTRP